MCGATPPSPIRLQGVVLSKTTGKILPSQFSSFIGQGPVMGSCEH